MMQLLQKRLPPSNERNPRKMAFIRLVVTVSLVLVSTLIAAITICICCLVLFPRRKKVGLFLLAKYSGVVLRIFRIHVTHNLTPEIIKRNEQGVIVTANHCSFLDIAILSWLFQSTFVSKSAVKYWPFVGWAAILIGILFLQRDSIKARILMIRTLANEAQHGLTAAIFPQGTTTPLAEKKPFQRGIFKVVEYNPDIAILPVTIAYELDQQVTWGDETFFENLLYICSLPVINVTVTVHPHITAEQCKNQPIADIAKSVETLVLNPTRV